MTHGTAQDQEKRRVAQAVEDALSRREFQKSHNWNNDGTLGPVCLRCGAHMFNFSHEPTLAGLKDCLGRFRDGVTEDGK